MRKTKYLIRLLRPVSAEALISLHNLIKQDSHTLNETSKQRLRKHVEKLANAAHVSFAERALLRDENRFLTSINNEAKVRRSTKSVVLGKAKVMSYEDIEEARAKRAAKEVITDKKGKSGRERKKATSEGGVTELDSKVVRMTEVLEPEVAQMTEVQPEVTQMTVVPEPEMIQITWRAPVARMI